MNEKMAEEKQTGNLEQRALSQFELEIIATNAHSALLATGGQAVALIVLKDRGIYLTTIGDDALCFKMTCDIKAAFNKPGIKTAYQYATGIHEDAKHDPKPNA